VARKSKTTLGRRPKSKTALGGRRKSKSRSRAKLHRDTAAIAAHTVALRQHSQAIKEINDVLINLTSTLIATKPRKPKNEIIADAMKCISRWLMDKKGVSKNDSTNPTKNMSTDFRLAGPPEMEMCLVAVKSCLAVKGDVYNLPSSNADQLVKGTLGVVVADIVKNTR
jgi:hypothetical protein